MVIAMGSHWRLSKIWGAAALEGATGSKDCFKCKAPKPQVEEAPVEEEGSVDRVLLNGEDDDEDENNLPLLKALLVAALFPQMVIGEQEGR
jgi:hypothetical protein